MGLATALGQELAKASAGVPLREIAAPVETRPNRVFEHEWQALGIAWQMAKSRINDRRDWAGRSEAASPRQGGGEMFIPPVEVLGPNPDSFDRLSSTLANS
ncbi:hypothetical protein GCM10011504_27700 [Siccirubricoccus deserti]|uniref:Uncharacterized protein n=1 Tax=Siccirubricoccus deserti TaxID=2013562 RepID=A0A9X0QYW0_9PROT|nr:hypothetical protein [Siccirubricoccus deserti]MBC4016170.1 hypothetical protein [Siccirubricoccus deserti]GGC47738.1 hypothetical protein GCM10011504_27700 [Siccirubricoccus deserti]